jgi:hypothetical protein
MTRKSWFDPNDHSLSVIRPELQYGSELKLPPKLLMIFAEQVLGDLKDELDLSPISQVWPTGSHI